MLFLLPAKVRNCSGMIKLPDWALLTRMRNAVSRRPRIILLLLALFLPCGTGAGICAYVYRQWQLAQVAVKERRPDEAQRRLELCLFLCPRSVQFHLLAARAARMQGDFEAAETHLNRCLKLNHGATEAIQLEFLLMRAQAGKVEEVARELSEYVENNSPDSPLILETLSFAYMRNLRYGPAFACLSRWIKVTPDSAEPYRWRGWVLERMNDREAAIKDYKRALELDPTFFGVRLQLGELYLERSDPFAARPHLEFLYEHYRDRPVVLARLGQCRFLEGEREEAQRLLEAAVQQLPNDSTVLIHLAKLAIQSDQPRYVEAEAWLDRALKVDPTDTEAEYLLISCLQGQGRQDEAHAMLKRLNRDSALLKRVSQLLQQEADNPITDPAALTDIGTLLIHSNERVGQYWLQRALAQNPNYHRARKALAEYYETKGEHDKAASYR